MKEREEKTTPAGTLAETLAKVEAIVRSGGDRDELLRRVVRTLHESEPRYDWTGIYIVEGTELVLHNQIGLPTPHERIPLGRGICGAAAASGETIVVPDVNADPRYLACSLKTRSEIVVPVRDPAGRVIAEIDIDSDTPDAFDETDRAKLERCAALISRLFE